MNKRWLIVAGVVNVLFVILHLAFWKMFNWKVELSRLAPENAAIMQIFNIIVIYICGFGAMVLLLLARSRATGGNAGWFLAFLGGFYLLRALIGVPFLGFSAVEGVVIAICLGTAWILFRNCGLAWNSGQTRQPA